MHACITHTILFRTASVNHTKREFTFLSGVLSNQQHGIKALCKLQFMRRKVCDMKENIGKQMCESVGGPGSTYYRHRHQDHQRWPSVRFFLMWQYFSLSCYQLSSHDDSNCKNIPTLAQAFKQLKIVKKSCTETRLIKDKSRNLFHFLSIILFTLTCHTLCL